MPNNYYNNYPNQPGYGYAPQQTIRPVGNYSFAPANYGYNQPMQQPAQGDRIYVNGRAGADAYPIPQGVNHVVLWDTEAKRFYIKGYDNNGMPRVLEDNDYSDHVEPESTVKPSVDLSNYATKDDIRKMIIEASKSFVKPDMTGYVTQSEFERVLSSLSVGNGGRIVMMNEPNA